MRLPLKPCSTCGPPRAFTADRTPLMTERVMQHAHVKCKSNKDVCPPWHLPVKAFMPPKTLESVNTTSIYSELFLDYRALSLILLVLTDGIRAIIVSPARVGPLCLASLSWYSRQTYNEGSSQNWCKKNYFLFHLGRGGLYKPKSVISSVLYGIKLKFVFIQYNFLGASVNFEMIPYTDSYSCRCPFGVGILKEMQRKMMALRIVTVEREALVMLVYT
jgi:hypothetical protein